jgi:hypothetical protein
VSGRDDARLEAACSTRMALPNGSIGDLWARDHRL